MKKKILITMLSLCFASSVLAAPAGMINMDDPKMPVDGMRMPMEKIKKGGDMGKMIHGDIMGSTTVPMSSFGTSTTPRWSSSTMPARSTSTRPIRGGTSTMPIHDDIYTSMSTTTRSKHDIKYDMDDPKMPVDVMPMDTMMTCTVAVPELRKGDGNKNGKGNMVMTLQNRLITLGYLHASSTGNFGEQTKAAVIKYQKDMGIAKPTGLFGQMTINKMKLRMKDDCSTVIGDTSKHEMMPATGTPIMFDGGIPGGSR